MFDKLAETKISGDGKVTAKRRITDEETVAEAEFAEARDDWFGRQGNSRSSTG
jgi:hypothetical protein